MMKVLIDSNIVLYLLLARESLIELASVYSNEGIWEECFSVDEPSKTLDFRQAAGLGQEIWSHVEVEKYIQQERATWD